MIGLSCKATVGLLCRSHGQMHSWLLERKDHVVSAEEAGTARDCDSLREEVDEQTRILASHVTVWMSDGGDLGHLWRHAQVSDYM